MDILNTIAGYKAEILKARESVAAMQPRTPLSMRASILARPVAIISEFKRRSPSKGEIAPKADIVPVVRGYAAAGCAGCSVLTDTRFFGGADTDLLLARAAVPDTPLLRKDFIISELQIDEAYALGADCILLIAALLSAERVAALTDHAHRLGLEVLLEVHGIDELDRVRPDIDLVGVNSRNLRNFDTDLDVARRMLDRLPAGSIKVAESGIRDAADITALRSAGYDAFLIGETLMRTPDPGDALKKLITRNSDL